MMKPFSERNVWEIIFSTPAAIFYCTFAEELHRASGSSKGWAAVAAALAAFLVRGCIGFWVATDASDGDRPAPYDFGSFVFFLPFLGLIYLFVRYGMRGFVPLGWYLLITLAAAALVWLPTAFALILMHHRTI
jgi:hypothetical protein